MEAVSQVILRNAARLPPGPVLVVNPARDTLVQQLDRADRPVRCVTQDFGDFRWLRDAGARAAFESVPALEAEDRTVVLNLPREKDRLALLLHAIAGQLDPQARLWLVGENRGGIKSSPRHLRRFFTGVSSLDRARHCALFEAIGPTGFDLFDLDDYVTPWSMTHAGREVQLRSLPGVFARGRLDRGTALLLEALAPLRPQGRILDFACGSGVLGLALLTAAEHAHVTLLDSSALAIESSRRALAANHLEAELLPSDGLAEVVGRYDWIVSNPPFHRGVASDLDIAANFFYRAGTFLTENGRIVIVFNRHLPYLKWVSQAFKRVERLAENGEFVVVRATLPDRSSQKET